jgi:hypothetical protein
MPGERGFISLLFAVLITGTALYLPQASSAPAAASMASTRGAAAQQASQRRPSLPLSEMVPPARARPRWSNSGKSLKRMAMP